MGIDEVTESSGRISMAKTYNLEFKGYQREPNWNSLPNVSAIYCVYAATPSWAKKRTLSGARLLYIGEAEDINDRVPEEPKTRRDKWAQELDNAEVLCVSYALIDGQRDRERAEAAMIYWHEPPCNSKYTDSFPFPRTTISTSGANKGLDARFTAERDDG